MKSPEIYAAKNLEKRDKITKFLQSFLCQKHAVLQSFGKKSATFSRYFEMIFATFSELQTPPSLRDTSPDSVEAC